MAKTYQAPLAQNFGAIKSTACTTVMASVATREWDNTNNKVIYTAAANDTKIGRLIFKATGQVPATNVVVFISDDDGTTFEPFDEEVLSSAGVTPSATVKSANCEISYQTKELYLRAGQSIGFGITATCTTGGVIGYAVLGDY